MPYLLTEPIHNIQIGFKTFTSAISLALFGAITIIVSLCSRIYGGLSRQIFRTCSTVTRVLAAGIRRLKPQMSSDNAESPSPWTSRTPSPSSSKRARTSAMGSLPLPLHSQPPEVLAEGRKATMGPGLFIRKIISFANFNNVPTRGRKTSQPKRGSSFLDLSTPSHRTSPSTLSDGDTIVSSSTSLSTPRDLAAESTSSSDMPYRKAPSSTNNSESCLYPRRPSHNDDDDEHTIHVIPLHPIRPTLPPSPRSPVYFQNPFTKPRQTGPTRQKAPRPRRNPKLALTLGEFFSSRNNDENNENDHVTSTPCSPRSATTNPSTKEAIPMSPRTIRFPPRRYSRSSHFPPRRGSHHTLPHRASSPEPPVESLPVPPSWRRKPRQPQAVAIDMFSDDSDEEEC